MKKNYIKPITECINLELENMLTGSTITSGIGEGSHEAASKERGFFDDDEVLDWN